MGKQAKKKRRKRTAPGQQQQQQQQQQHHHQQQQQRQQQQRVSRSGHDASMKMLELVASEWPALVGKGSFVPLEAGTGELGAMWDWFGKLSRAEKAEACLVVEEGKVRLLETIVQVASEAEGGSGALDGLFLAIRAPGREDTHHAAIFRTWAQLLERQAFCEPAAREKQCAQDLLDAIVVQDVEAVGSRSALGLSRTHVERARELIEGALGKRVASGRAAGTSIRTGDEEDDPSKIQSRASDKSQSLLLTGSLASTLAVYLAQAIQARFKQQAPAPAVELCVHKYDYLRESLEAFVAAEGPKAARLLEGDGSEALRLVFCCAFRAWGGPDDIELRALGERLVVFHSQVMAEALLAGPGARKRLPKAPAPTAAAPNAGGACADLSTSSSGSDSEQGSEQESDDNGDDDNGTEGDTACQGSAATRRLVSASDVPHDEGGDGWKVVPGGSRRARRASLRQQQKQHKQQERQQQARAAGAQQGAPSRQRRGESAETISLSSITSSSTAQEEPLYSSTGWAAKTPATAPPPPPSARTTEAVKPPSPGPADVSSSNSSTDSGAEEAAKPATVEYPWAPLVDGLQPTIVRQLHHDIEEMASMLEQIAERRRPWQLAVAERIKSAVEHMFPGATATVFGSLATGLAAPCSDLDMVVQNISQPSHLAMRALSTHLQHQSWVQMIQAVEHSAVPVIRLSTAQIPISFGNQGSLINVDITFDNFSHRGLRTCAMVRGLMAQFPPLKPLTLVLKQFLVEKGLNDPFIGGLSSYGLVLMIVAVVQEHFPEGLPERMDDLLGVLFVLFLRTYSDLAFVEHGVWIQAGGAPEEEAAAVHASLAHMKAFKSPLYIVDPLDIRNNIGRSCFGIHQVVQAFAEAAEAIQVTTIHPGGSNTGGGWSVLGSVFSTGHHRHVVQLVTLVWCPPENPIAPKPSMTLREWAITAKSVLDTIEQKGRVCPWCKQKPHASACTLHSLKLTFPE